MTQDKSRMQVLVLKLDSEEKKPEIMNDQIIKRAGVAVEVARRGGENGSLAKE